MRQDCPNYFMTLSIYQDPLDKLNRVTVTNDFVGKMSIAADPWAPLLKCDYVTHYHGFFFTVFSVNASDLHSCPLRLLFREVSLTGSSLYNNSKILAGISDDVCNGLGRTCFCEVY